MQLEWSTLGTCRDYEHLTKTSRWLILSLMSKQHFSTSYLGISFKGV